jgi:hypothetical protein
MPLACVVIAPPAWPMTAPARSASSSASVTAPDSSKPIDPVCPPGFVAVTVVWPIRTPVGTRKVTLLPLAATTGATTPPTRTTTFKPPKPEPVIVTDSP